MKTVAIIMAGGKGERLWPRSRKNCPKQFLNLFSKKQSMLQQTIERIRLIVKIRDIFLITNKQYFSLIKKQLPNFPEKNIIYEPSGKNTSPAIQYASIEIAKRYGDDVISFVLPSDHLILNNKNFILSLKKATKLAKKNNLVLLGIKPTRPDTNYGYIKLSSKNNVDSFIEKPNINVVKKIYKNKFVYWNSGIFVWKISSILKAFKKYAPKQNELFSKLYINKVSPKLIQSIYSKIPSISIDYAIMEKANNVKIIPTNFIWDDVGSWLSFSRVKQLDRYNNYIEGNVLAINSTNSIFLGQKKLISVFGVKNIVIVDSDDALLITTKEKINDIKKFIKILSTNKKQYL